MPKKYSKHIKGRMTSDGYMPVKPKKVTVKDVMREIPGATKTVIKALVGAPGNILKRAVRIDNEFFEETTKPSEEIKQHYKRIREQK